MGLPKNSGHPLTIYIYIYGHQSTFQFFFFSNLEAFTRLEEIHNILLTHEITWSTYNTQLVGETNLFQANVAKVIFKGEKSLIQDLRKKQPKSKTIY